MRWVGPIAARWERHEVSLACLRLRSKTALPFRPLNPMLIANSSQDVETSTGMMRVNIVSPKIGGYPRAQFPGVVVFSEIYNPTAPVMRYAELIASRASVVLSLRGVGTGLKDYGLPRFQRWLRRR